MPRTVIDWNAIPLHVKEIDDKDKFKAAAAQPLQPVTRNHSKGTAPTLLVPPPLGKLNNIVPDPEIQMLGIGVYVALEHLSSKSLWSFMAHQDRQNHKILKLVIFQWN